jgi:hypothetical protein
VSLTYPVEWRRPSEIGDIKLYYILLSLVKRLDHKTSKMIHVEFLILSQDDILNEKVQRYNEGEQEKYFSP